MSGNTDGVRPSTKHEHKHARVARSIAALAVATTFVCAHVVPVSATTARDRNLVVIGDSLTFGAERFGGLSWRVVRTNRWRSIQVSGVVGRSIEQGVTQLRRMKPGRQDAVVVALGTNDMMTRRSRQPALLIDRFMAAAKGRPVLWLNLEFATTRPDWRNRGIRFNRELRRAQSRWPNLHIADWDAFFDPEGQSRFTADGVHLTTQGYRTRVSFMLRRLRAWAVELDTPATTTTIPPESSSTTVDPSSSSSTSTSSSTTTPSP